MKDIDAQQILEAYEAVDSETGERMSPDKHAKAVQWTKDIKAKLAQAQKIGDSKEANKLQRYLDMHGIDEADDQPYDGLDDQHRQNVDQHTLLNALNSRIQQTTDYASIEDFAIKRMRELYDRYVEQGKDIEEIEKLLVANWIDGFIEDAILRAEY
ncbi:hypothetical protein CMI37_39115 [Candidatus Pacearchaeota archaeon]|nr:hypothetical protein [Candidatus Pacearchaeota archaeon]|tara:strand:+ start:282 stop:749 length:468 start_codon:yes stop_codon:yes gene_type:complete